MRRNPSSPISPSPIWVCRSLWLPKAPLLSLKCQHLQCVQPDLPVNFFDHCGIAINCAEIVASGEGMTGVSADTHTCLVVDLFDDLAKLAETSADGGALACHQLQECYGAGALGCIGMNAVEGGGDACDTRF